MGHWCMPDALRYCSLSTGSASWYNQTSHGCFPLSSVGLLLRYSPKTRLIMLYDDRGIIDRKKVHVKSHGSADDQACHLCLLRKERNVASRCSGWALRYASTSWKSSSIRLMVAASNRP